MTHELPFDPRDVVIQWRSSGGLSGPTASESDLVIRADGSVTVGGRFGGGGRVDGRITPERLQDLLRLALDDNAFFTIDEIDVDRRIATTLHQRKEAGEPGGVVIVPSGPPYVDAGTTSIEIAADGKRHEVNIHGLFAAARDLPEIEELRRLRAIEMALVELAEEMIATTAR